MNQVVLLFGGTSEEKLVSTASAQNIVKYLKNPSTWFISSKGEVHETTLDELVNHQNPFKNLLQPRSPSFAKQLSDAIPKLKDKTIFIGLHGTEGEDGKFQEMFEKNKIAFTGSGSKSSALCFNKISTKEIAKSAGLPLAEQLYLPRETQSEAQALQEKKLRDFFEKKKKIVVKPVASGSSYGLHIVTSPNILESAIKDLRRYDMMAEEFIEGRELTVGVFNSHREIRPLPASEVVLEQGSSFDYEGKYLGRGTKELTPAPISDEEMKKCQQLAIQSHTLFSCYGYSRTDMILTSRGPVFLETNTLPGMTKASFFPQQLEAAHLPMQGFVDEMLKLAEARYS
ncbi:MAG: ATP-grasp domain-containing protein [Bdellovibrionota bacterium]